MIALRLVRRVIKRAGKNTLIPPAIANLATLAFESPMSETRTGASALATNER
jgi:hypothetical protein